MNNILKPGRVAAILLLLSILLGNSVAQNSGPLSPWFFIQMTDPQFGMYEGNDGFEKETELYEKAVAVINRLGPDFVVITGDFVHDSRSGEQIAEFKRITAEIDPGIPVYYTPGNHDVGQNPDKESLEKYVENYGPDTFSFEHKGSRFIGFNSSLIKSNSEDLEQVQFEWLKEALDNSKEKKQIVLFCHYPFFIKAMDEPETYSNIGPEDREKYLSLFQDNGVDAIFSGHYHNNAVARFGEMDLVTTSAVGKPLGEAASGMRIVKVVGDRIEHNYYGLDEIPLNLADGREPVRIGVAGLSHSHVIPLLRNMDREDYRIVGIAESDTDLSQRYAKEFGISQDLLFESLEEMLEQTRPQGVITFTSIFDHLKVVEACAPRGIDVMVEKPLAVSTRHAEAMSKLSKEYGILLLTNYETTWYPSNYEGYRMITEGELGQLRKIIVYDGHKGPEEIRVNSEFLEWLTDPVLNGGGAVTDFGCYGADLITWILKGEKPMTVYADLKQYKPDIYPRVDDDATILLSYPTMEGVIHASWNWPFSRKDMHVYGSTGYIYLDNAETIRYRLEEKSKENVKKIPLSKAPFNDPFAFFAAAIKKEIEVEPTDLSSLEINLTVVEILEAARKSSKTGKVVKLTR